MTQRFGGIFSTLNHKDLIEIYRFTDNEEYTQETYIGPNFNLQTMSNREIYIILEGLETSMREMLEMMTGSERRGYPQPDDSHFFTQYRQDLASLRRIKAKLKRSIRD